VEKRVPLSVMRAGVVRGQDTAVGVDVTSIEQLIILVAGFAAVDHVRTDVVEVAEAAGEGDVGGVSQTGVAKNEKTILYCLESVQHIWEAYTSRGFNAYLGNKSEDLLEVNIVAVFEEKVSNFRAESGVQLFDVEDGGLGSGFVLYRPGHDDSPSSVLSKWIVSLNRPLDELMMKEQVYI